MQIMWTGDRRLDERSRASSRSFMTAPLRWYPLQVKGDKHMELSLIIRILKVAGALFMLLGLIQAARRVYIGGSILFIDGLMAVTTGFALQRGFSGRLMTAIYCGCAACLYMTVMLHSEWHS